MSKTPGRRVRVLVAALVAAAAVAIAGAMSLSASPTITTAPMSNATADALKQQGITVSDLSADSTVSAKDAVAVARQELYAIAGETPAEVSLVTFTDAEHGKELPDGTIEPTYADKAAWAVVMTGVEVPVFGPNVEGRKVESYQGTLVVFVDAQSGDYLEAIAF